MKKIFLILFFNFILFQFICPFDVYSQPSITWQRSYDSGFNTQDYCKGICKVIDGNYILVGAGGVFPNQIMIVKINSYGDTLWKKLYLNGDNEAVTETSDGGFLIAPGFKFNSFGDSLWQRNYDSTGIFNMYDVIQTSDGGYLSCGRNQAGLGYIIKTNSLGYLQWYLNFTDSSITNLIGMEFNALTETYSNGYIIGGYAYSLDLYKIELVRLGINGNILWRNNYGSAGDSLGGVIRITKIPPYYFLGCGAGYMKIDDNGNVVSAHRIRDDSSTYTKDMQPLGNNSIALITNFFHQPPLTESSRIRICDMNGSIISSRTISFSNFIELNKLKFSENGDIIFVGAAEPDTNFSTNSDFFVIRTDSNLNYPPIKINKNINKVPLQFTVYQNYPNPFNSGTIIKFEINKKDNYELKLYDILGRQVDLIFKKDISPGVYIVNYIPFNLSSGVYIYQLKSSNNIISKIMTFIK